MAKNYFSIVKSWDFDCEPKEIGGENFIEVSPIPIEFNENTLSMTDVEKIIQENSKNGDCCCNSGGLWHDGDNNCWFTGNRQVAEELVKKGAKVATIRIRHLVKV